MISIQTSRRLHRHFHGGTGNSVTYPAASTNALNQYTNITTEGGRFILGEAPAANAVTVNNLTTSRAGGLGFFWKQLTASNASVPVWSNDSVVSNGVTVTGRTWTPAASVAPAYDFDGNLTSDGRWDYLWDAENRLIQMKSTAAALAAATASGIPAQKLDFVYDAQSRRVSKTVSTSTNGTTWTFLSNQRFLYDGWNMIAEYSAPSATSTTLTLQATHTWGIDLSGTLQGAGGVGGLLATNLIAVPASACYPAYDGNGNISAWIDATGTLLARMDYSPFGQMIAQYKFTPSGSTTLSRLAFGFSTKYTDAESGLLYYGYRYYDPVTGRWPSRDPIEEDGGVNLYTILTNNAVNIFDLLGMKKVYVGWYGANAGFPPIPINGINSSVIDPNMTDPLKIDPKARFRSLIVKEGTKYILGQIDVNGDRKIKPEETKDLDLRIFGWSWGAVSSVKSSMELLKANRDIKNGVQFPFLHGYEICSLIKIEKHFVMDPVIKIRTGGKELEIGEYTKDFTNYYQTRKGKAIVRDSSGKEIGKADGMLVGNNVIGMKIPIVKATGKVVQAEVNVDPKFKKMTMIWGNGTIKNEDGNHSFMPMILEKNGIIHW